MWPTARDLPGIRIPIFAPFDHSFRMLWPPALAFSAPLLSRFSHHKSPRPTISSSPWLRFQVLSAFRNCLPVEKWRVAVQVIPQVARHEQSLHMWQEPHRHLFTQEGMLNFVLFSLLVSTN